jgi:hypothetical protein
MKCHGILASFALFASASANAVIFAPTDQNVNFINFGITGNAAGLELGIFEDTLVSFAGQPWLSVNVTGDVIDFSPVIGQNTNYTLTNNASNMFTLLGSDHFQLALRRGVPSDPDFIAWSLADSVSCNGANNTCFVSWILGTTQLVVDIETVNPVPVPAAVWLFGSGLIGLAGVARRRKV